MSNNWTKIKEQVLAEVNTYLEEAEEHEDDVSASTLPERMMDLAEYLIALYQPTGGDCL